MVISSRRRRQVDLSWAGLGQLLIISRIELN